MEEIGSREFEHDLRKSSENSSVCATSFAFVIVVALSIWTLFITKVYHDELRSTRQKRSGETLYMF